jgi:DNA-binding response OmpR family regulator
MGEGTILVVDDDDDAREAFVQLLEAEGFEAVGAEGVAAAIAALDVSRPRAVLLDGWLGADTGEPVLAAARARPPPDRPRVILVSGAWGHDAALARLAAGVDGVLQKPFGFEALAAMLAKLGVAKPRA